jgi:hypothetical protein
MMVNEMAAGTMAVETRTIQKGRIRILSFAFMLSVQTKAAVETGG